MMRYSSKRRLFFGVLFLIVTLIGIGSAYFLTQLNQDIRQQASGECSPNDPYCSCDINGSNCVIMDENDPREKVDEGSELQSKGILSSSYKGSRPTSKGSCSGVWQNDFCYMPGDELAGGYIVVESGRYNYPYFEKKEVYEKIDYAAESIDIKLGSKKDLGEDCGGNGLAINGVCYAFGSSVNGYFVMPPRSDNCDNSAGDYCYAHLKKIETSYDDWDRAVSAYEEDGNYSQLERLYEEAYGISFEVGGLFDSDAANAEKLSVEALMAALTNADVIKGRAAQQNQILEKKTANGERLTPAEEKLYKFNQQLIADENLDIRYQQLDQISESTVSQTVLNRAVSEMYQDLVTAGGDADLDKISSTKFQEIFGYDPSEKYTNTDAILEAFGIDPEQLETDRENYADYQAQLAEQRVQQKEQAKADALVQAQQEEEEEIKELLTNYVENSSDRDNLKALYLKYVGSQPGSSLSNEEMIKELSRHSPQIALQTYYETGDSTYLKLNYYKQNNLTEGSGFIPDNDYDLLRELFDDEVAKDVYSNSILPGEFNSAVASFSHDPDQLEALCRTTLGSRCSLNAENATDKLSQILKIMYQDNPNVQVEELAVSYANDLFAEAKEEEKKSWLVRALINYGASQSNEALGLAAATTEAGREAMELNIGAQNEAAANYQKARETSQIFDVIDTFDYANQVRSQLSDYTWGTALGNATMYDNIFDRHYDLKDDFGLTGLDKTSMAWNQIQTQVFGTTNQVENVATNYAIAKQQGYTGPANTNVADVTFQAAQNMGVLDYGYQQAASGHYASATANRVGSALADWAVTAGTYVVLSGAASPGTNGLSQNNLTPTLSYDEVRSQAAQAGDKAAAAIRQAGHENLVAQYNQGGENNVDLDQYISFQVDDEITRSRKELNWERVEKVVAPTIAVVTLPIAVASGAGLGVVAGLGSSSFSLYQGAGAKAQALELQRVVISEDVKNRQNAAVLARLNEQGISYGDPEYELAYEKGLTEVEQQAYAVNQQGNIMVASSAVAALTSGAGVIQGFASPGVQAAMTAGTSVNRTTQMAMNVSQVMSTTGRIGGIGLSAYNVSNSIESISIASQSLNDLGTIADIEELVASGEMTVSEAEAKKSEIRALKGQKIMSILSGTTATFGAAGNALGFFGNSQIRNSADLVIDIASIPVGSAVDAQNVAQNCFNPQYPAQENDCRDAWIGLALSVTQDVAQVKSSAKAYGDYQSAQRVAKVEDLSQKITATDQRLTELVNLPNRTIGENLELIELKVHRQNLVDQALAVEPNLNIPTVKLASDFRTEIDGVELLRTASENFSQLMSRASQVEADDPELALNLRQQAESAWDRQQEIVDFTNRIEDVDQEVDRNFSQISKIKVEELRAERQSLVDEIETRINDPALRAANLEEQNLQLLAALKDNYVFESYDSLRIEDQTVGLTESDLPPPEETSLQRKTGLAALLPAGQEQNRTLDFLELQQRLTESYELNAQRNELTIELNALKQENPDDPLVRMFETELSAVEKNLSQNDQRINQLSPQDLEESPNLWQRLTGRLTGSSERLEYEKGMVALRQLDSLQIDLQERQNEIQELALKNNLSTQEQIRLNEIEHELTNLNSQYDAAEKIVREVTTRVANKIESAADTDRTPTAIGGALASISRDLRQTIPLDDIENRLGQVFSQITDRQTSSTDQTINQAKNQLEPIKNDYDQLLRAQAELSKNTTELDNLRNRLSTLDSEQTDERLQLVNEFEALESRKSSLNEIVERLEPNLMRNVVSEELSQRTLLAAEQGRLDIELDTIRDEQLNRLTDSELNLNKREQQLITDLLGIRKQIFSGELDGNQLVMQRSLYQERLNDLNQNILGSTPSDGDYQRLSQAQQYLKTAGLIDAANERLIKGDSQVALELFTQKEFRLPVEDQVLAAHLETVVRDAEFRTGISDGVDFFNTRTNQMDTLLKVLSGDRVAVELTTSGGKTFVGAVTLKAQTEILGVESGVYIAKPGQENDIQSSLVKTLGLSADEVIILDNTRLSDGDYVKKVLKSSYLVADPSNIEFIRNSANNYQDSNFKTANQVYQKLTNNSALYIDELQITLDPSRQAINSVGRSSGEISDSYVNAARAVGDVIDQTLLREADWGSGDHEFLRLRTEEGAEIAKFNSEAQNQIFRGLAEKMNLSTDDYELAVRNAVDLEQALSQGPAALKQKLNDLSLNLSPAKVENILDQIDMMNTFAQGLKMHHGTDYIRQVDSVLVKNGGPDRPVTVPAAGGTPNEGQSYHAKLQAAMEYIGARSVSDNPNYAGLTASPNLAYKSTIADYLGDLKSSSVGAVTGAMADGRGVIETALGLVTYRSTEAVEKILGVAGSSTGERINVERSYLISRDNDVSGVVALKQAGRLDQSASLDSQGNLKVVLGFDGAKSSLDFAKQMAESGAFADASYAVKNPSGDYSLVKLNEAGEVISNRTLETKQVQDLYDGGAENLITIIGRSGVTGDSIKTAKNVPGVTVTSFDTPEGLVAQSGARIDRGGEIADQFALIVDRGMSRLTIDDPTDFLNVTKMTESDFLSFRDNVSQVQLKVEQAKNTQALDQGVLAASTRVLSDLVRNSDDSQIKNWASEKLLEFYTEARGRDLDLDGGAEQSLAARQRKIVGQVAEWQKLLSDPANNQAIELIRQNNPDLYEQMKLNAGVERELAYANGSSMSKEAVMTAKNLTEFIEKHNQYVTAESENRYVAASGQKPVTNQIATTSQRNSIEAVQAEGRVEKVTDTVQDLAKLGSQVSQPLKLAQAITNYTKVANSLVRLPKQISQYVSDQRVRQNNIIDRYERDLAELSNLKERLTETEDAITAASLQEEVDELEVSLDDVSFGTTVAMVSRQFFRDELQPRWQTARKGAAYLFGKEQTQRELESEVIEKGSDSDLIQEEEDQEKDRSQSEEDTAEPSSAENIQQAAQEVRDLSANTANPMRLAQMVSNYTRTANQLADTARAIGGLVGDLFRSTETREVQQVSQDLQVDTDEVATELTNQAVETDQLVEETEEVAEAETGILITDEAQTEEEELVTTIEENVGPAEELEQPSDIPLEPGDEALIADITPTRAERMTTQVTKYLSSLEQILEAIRANWSLENLRTGLSGARHLLAAAKEAQLEKGLLNQLFDVAEGFVSRESEYRSLKSEVQSLIAELGLKNASIANNTADLKIQKTTLEDHLAKKTEQEASSAYRQPTYEWHSLTRTEFKDFEQLINSENYALPELFANREQAAAYQPRYAAQVEGSRFFFSGVIQRDRNGRKFMVFYVEAPNGQLFPRVLYKSVSQGTWRATPGFDAHNKIYSKGLNKDLYTNETQLSPAFLDLVEAIEATNQVKYTGYDPISSYFNLAELAARGISTYQRAKPVEIKISDQLTEYVPGKLSSRYLTNQQINNMEQFLSNLSVLDKDLPDFNQEPLMIRHDQHQLLGKVTYETYQGTFNVNGQDRPLNWEMGTTSDGKVWINNIYLADAKISSYGNLREVVNGGILTSKPIDYSEQVHAVPSHLKSQINDDYTDITPLLNLLPPIKEYRLAKNTKQDKKEISISETSSPDFMVRDLETEEINEFKGWVNSSELEEKIIDSANEFYEEALKNESIFYATSILGDTIENFEKNKPWKVFGESFVPTRSMKIDENEWLLVERIFHVSLNDVLLMYAKVGEDFVPRVFYKSNSGGIWRGSPGVEGGHVWKSPLEGEDSVGREPLHYHYVQTGQLDPRLNQFISNNINSFQRETMSDYRFLFDPFFANRMDWYSFGEEIETKRFSSLENLTKLEAGFLTIENYGNIDNKTLFEIDFPEGFIPDFSGSPELSYKEDHPVLGEVTYELYGGAQFNGEAIEWLMAKDSAGRVWVSNVFFSEGEISTYGTQKLVIDCGILTSKPLEYPDQVTALDQNSILPTSSNYVDITPVLSNLKPIRDYKEAKADEVIVNGENQQTSFNDLCSSCSEVRNQTKRGLEDADQSWEAAQEKLNLVETKRTILSQAQESGNSQQINQLQTELKQLEQEADELKQQALTQIDQTRKEVVNDHGMQNQCVQLYLNAWVDTREAEIRQTKADVNHALRSVYKATQVAEEILAQDEMTVVTKRGFLGLGREEDEVTLTEKDHQDVRGILEGHEDQLGLREMAEFKSLGRRPTFKNVIGGLLGKLKNSFTGRPSISNVINQTRIISRNLEVAVNRALPQNMSRSAAKEEYQSYLKSTLGLEKYHDLVPLTAEIELNATDHIKRNDKDKALQEIKEKLNFDHQNYRFLAEDELVVREFQQFADDLIDLINQERAVENKDLLPKTKIHVSLNNDLNAYAMPDGSIVIHQGLINALSTKDQLFAILAHEISHFEDKYGRWYDSLNLFSSQRAQELKADQTSLLRLGKLGFQPKAMQSAAETLASYTETSSDKNKFWQKRDVKVYEETGLEVSTDLAHGSLFNRNLSIELSANYQELGLEANIQPTAMPGSWKGETSLGFYRELVSLPANHNWRTIWQEAPKVIRQKYYDDFFVLFRNKIVKAKAHLRRIPHSRKEPFWDKVYNVILYHQTTNQMNQDLNKFEYLVSLLTDDRKLKEQLRPLSISSANNIELGRFRNSVDLEEYPTWDPSFFKFSPNFFKVQRKIKNITPELSKLESHYLEELAQKSPWIDFYRQADLQINLDPSSVLKYLLNQYEIEHITPVRFSFDNNILEVTLDDYFSAVEEEFDFLERIKTNLSVEALNIYRSTFSRHQYKQISDLIDKIVGKISSEANFEPDHYWDRVIALFSLYEPEISNEKIYQSILSNYSSSNLLSPEQKTMQREYLAKQLNLGEVETVQPLIRFHEYRGISQLDSENEQKLREKLRKNLIAVLTTNGYRSFSNSSFGEKLLVTLPSLRAAHLSEEDEAYIRQFMVDFALDKNNFYQIYADESQEDYRFGVANELLLQFCDSDKVLELANQLHLQYFTYLESLVIGNKWNRLAAYLSLVGKKYKGTSGIRPEMTIFKDFSIIKRLGEYLQNLAPSQIDQDISGYYGPMRRELRSFEDDALNYRLTNQLRSFFSTATDQLTLSWEQYYFGTNELEASLLQPLIDYELTYFENRAKELEGIELYHHFERYYPAINDKTEKLNMMAENLFEELDFPEAFAFLQTSLAKGHQHYFHYFLENHLKTYEEYQAVTGQGVNLSEIQKLSAETATITDTLVSNYLTNIDEAEALDFFEASISGDDERVKYHLAKYYLNIVKFEEGSVTGRLITGSRIAGNYLSKIEGVRVNSEGQLVGPGAATFPTFDEFVFSFYTLSKSEKTAFLSKLLSEKLLRNEKNYSKVAELLTSQIEDTEMNLKPLLKNIIQATLSQVEGSTKVQLGLSRSLADSFLQGDSRGITNQYALDKIMQNIRDDVDDPERFDLTSTQKVFDELLNLNRDVTHSKNKELYSHVLSAVEKYHQLDNEVLAKYGLHEKPTEISERQGGIPVGKFITELGKSLGSLGVRFLQVFGQYFELPPELREEFLSVYDNASDLYMANLFQSSLKAIETLEEPNPEISAEEMSWRQDQARRIKELLQNVRVIRKIGGGSINTTYLVEIENSETSEKNLHILKISNPNVSDQVNEVARLVESVVEDLKVLDKKRSDQYEVVDKLIQTLQQWNNEDIRDENFVRNDQLFRSFYPYQSVNGLDFQVSEVTDLYNRWVKVEDYVEGETLKQHQADFETEIKENNGEITLDHLAKAQKMEELISDVVKDYLLHFNQPVELEDGTKAYILHSDLHVGNIMADNDLSKVSVIDRSYYLTLSEKDAELVRILLSDQKTDMVKFRTLANFLLEANQVKEKQGRWAHWRKYLSYAKVALKNKLSRHQSEEDKQVAFFNAMMQETDRIGLDFPLNIRLFVKNMSAINKMLSKIGDDKLSDYLNGTYKQEYDGSWLLEDLGYSINDNKVGDEELSSNFFQNEIGEKYLGSIYGCSQTPTYSLV